MSGPFFVQLALLALACVVVFAIGARQKALPAGWRTRGEIAQATLIVVLLFAVLTEGRGCTPSTSAATDCSASTC